MKKLLALVLALVMTLGLATVGASAATTKYADKNDIDYQEAADVLSSVGVFEGKGENFAPKDNLNRAEAAKLVAYLMLGTKTAEAIHGNGNRFSDVPADHWAVGYIEYLATAGVVSGVGDNKFNPNGQVTAVQFAKMLNVALGYDAQVEGYVGESWNINIMKQANDDEIFKTLNVGSNDALTREQAAQMCLNALKANTVEYESKGDTLTINNSTVVLNAKKAKDKTTTATKGNAIKDDDANGTTANPWTLQLGEDLYNGDLKMEKTRDDFGRPANKWTYKMEKVGTYANTGDLKATYTDEIKNGPIYDLLGSSVYDHLVLAAGANNYATLHYFEDGVGYNKSTDGLVNGSTTAATNKTAVQYFVLKNGDKAINYNADGKGSVSSGNGSVTQIFVDKDDNVDIVVMNTYVFQAASDYRASTEDIVVSIPSDAGQQANAYDTMSLNNYRLELNDFPQIKDYKKDDYLLVTAHKDGNRYKVDSVEKAEKLTGKVDKVVIKDSVTLDGELKKYNKTATDKTKENEFSVGQEATVVLDKYGYIVYVDEAVVASNYVFISELYQNGGSTSKVQGNAYFSDGTNQTITIKEIAKDSDRSALVAGLANPGMNKGVVGTKNEYVTTPANYTANEGVSNYTGWYTYSKNSADEYTLTAVKTGWTLENEYYSGTNSNTDNVLTKGDTVKFLQHTALSGNDGSTNVPSSAVNTTAANAKANNKTVMVVAYKDNTDVDVYTGVKNLPDITLNANDGTKVAGGASIFSVLDGDGYARYVFVSLEGNYSVYGTESENLLYIVKYDNEHSIANNKRYYTYKALDENANEILIETDTAFGGTSGVYQAYYKTNKNSDGRYTRALTVPTGNGAKYFATANEVTGTITAEGETLSMAGENFTLANNSKIVYVSRVDELNKKDTINDSGFEADIVTADGLAAFVKGYNVTYSVQAKLDDTYQGRGGKIIEAYVTITGAQATGTSSSATSANGILAVKLADTMRGKDTTHKVDFAGKQTYDQVHVYYSGNIVPAGSDIADAITEEFDRYDALKDYEVRYENTASSGTATYAYNVYKNNGFIAAMGYGNSDTIHTPEVATVTSSSDWSIDTAAKAAAATGTLVVPYGVKLTVDGVNVSVANLIVAGSVEIRNNGKLDATNASVLKSGHVDVKTGGKWLNTTLTEVEGQSIVTDSTSTNIVKFGATTDIMGTVSVAGGTFELPATVNNNGGKISVTGTTTIAGTTTINTDSGATTSFANTVKTQGTVTLSGTGTNTVGGTKAESFTNSTSGKTITLTLADGLTVTSLTNASAKSQNGTANVYEVTSDTQTVVINVRNTTSKPLSLGVGSAWTVETPTDATTQYTVSITVDNTAKEDGSEVEVAAGNTAVVRYIVTSKPVSKT